MLKQLLNVGKKQINGFYKIIHSLNIANSRSLTDDVLLRRHFKSSTRNSLLVGIINILELHCWWQKIEVCDDYNNNTPRCVLLGRLTGVHRLVYFFACGKLSESCLTRYMLIIASRLQRIREISRNNLNQSIQGTRPSVWEKSSERGSPVGSLVNGKR